jgi:hypothetical protein
MDEHMFLQDRRGSGGRGQVTRARTLPLTATTVALAPCVMTAMRERSWFFFSQSASFRAISLTSWVPRSFALEKAAASVSLPKIKSLLRWFGGGR